MKNSFRSAVAHLASQPRLLALAALIAVGAHLATGYTGSTQGQISSGGGTFSGGSPSGGEGMRFVCTDEGACIASSGPGQSECGPNLPCERLSQHMVCNAQDQCVSSPGAGPNDCIHSDDCGQHMECANTTCVLVPGPGEDGCNSDAHCGGARELQNPVIIDDGDAGFTASTVVARPTGYAGDNRTVVPNMWAFSAPAAGIYDVYATWIAAPANNAATSYSISYRINNVLQSLPRVFVNQTVSPDDASYQNSQWEKIGSVDATGPAQMTVLGATEPNGYIDAVAFVLRTQCTDGLDNDSDGNVDFPADLGCVNAADNDEYNPIADVGITKSGPSTMVRGSSGSYTITVRNAGPDAAENVTITDFLREGAIFNASRSSSICSQIGSDIVCAVGTLNNTQSMSVTLAFSVPSTFTCNGTTSSTLFNQARVSTTTADPNISNYVSQMVSTTITCPVTADLSITKTGPSSVVRGSSGSYTLTVTNTGPSAASGAITDTIPAGLTFNRSRSSSTCTQYGNSIYCPTSLLSSGQSSSVTLVFDIPSTYACNGTIQNFATVTSSVFDSNSNNNQSQTVSTTVTCPVINADLSITKTGQSTVARGGRVSYTLTAMNAGPNAATNLIFADPIPAGLTFASGSSSTICAQNGTNIVCNRSEALNSGQSTSVTIAFNVPTSFTCNGTIQNRASISTAATDPNPANNQSNIVSTTVTCPVTADLSITKTGPVSVTRSGSISYTLTVSNAGPSAASGAITDTIPAGLTFNRSRSSSTCTQYGNSIYCPTSLLSSGQSTTVNIAFNVPNTYACNGIIQNRATVSSITTDPNPANNQSLTVSTTVTCPVASSAASSSSANTSVPAAQRGNLYVNVVSPPILGVNLLAGTTTNQFFTFSLRATKENMRVNRIILTNGVSGTAPSVINTVDLYIPTQTAPFATATVGGCGSGFTTGFCAIIPGDTLIVPANGVVNISARANLKNDGMGVSNTTVTSARLSIPGYYQNSLIIPVINAVGVTTSTTAVVADSDATEEGEIFIGRTAPGSSASIYSSIFSVQFARIQSIFNANPDANGTAVPTGLSGIGRFRFTAAANINAQNGLNRILLRSIKFTVNADNVLLARNSLRAYNLADATVKTQPCTGGSALGTLTGTFTVTCDVTGINANVESNASTTFVLEAIVENPKLDAARASHLQISLPLRLVSQPFRWVDTDSGGTSAEYFTFPNIVDPQLFSTQYDL